MNRGENPTDFTYFHLFGSFLQLKRRKPLLLHNVALLNGVQKTPLFMGKLCNTSGAVHLCDE